MDAGRSQKFDVGRNKQRVARVNPVIAYGLVKITVWRRYGCRFDGGEGFV